jgi:Uncharacterised protein conserved in bacteria (DUF2336)
MSDRSPRMQGAARTGLGSLAIPFAGLSDGTIAHGYALRPFFTSSTRRWTDAMIARTRRHMAGCTVAVEMALRLDMIARMPDAQEALESLEPGYVWRVLASQPDMMSARLFAQYRIHAGFSLLCGNDGGEAIRLLSEQVADAPDLLDKIAAFSIARMRWNDRAAEDAPMRTDLPAEAMEELVALCGAILAHGLAATDAIAVDQIYHCIDDGCQTMLAHHDEESGVLGAASMLARALRGYQIDDGTMSALAQGDPLLLCAVIGERCDVPIDRVALALIDGDDAMMLALCRAAGIVDEATIVMHMCIGPVRPAVRDDALAAMIDLYETMSADDARRMIAPLRMAASLHEKLARLGHWSAP